MDRGARALLTAQHAKVRLVPVEVRQEHDASFVETGRRFEDVARQSDRGREDLAVAVAVVLVEGRKSSGGGGSDGVKDAEQGVAAAFDQARVIEIVTGVHADAGREAVAEGDLARVVKK